MSFRMILSVGAALLAAHGPAVSAERHRAASVDAASPRHALDLSRGWRFRFGDHGPEVTRTTFDDRDWQAIRLPHTWNRLGEYSKVRSSKTNVDQGVGWYRLSFTPPPAARGKRRILQFDGVGEVAEIWVNGVSVGRHEGAFARFRFDITDQLRGGAANLIVVKADNSKPAPGSSTANVVPLGGDFFIHGGIYRGMSLIDVDSAQIDMLDHGGPGVYLGTPVVTAERATVALLARLRNIGGAARRLRLVTTIADAAGRAVAIDDVAAPLSGGQAIEVRRSIDLRTPHLWQGRADPYLYGVTVELRDGATIVDRVVQPLGIRSFRFDPDKGFILNGKPTPLHGASRHQDHAGKGWALTPADHAEDLALMLDMGVNTVRHAHYQHAQEWVDGADRSGLAVWAEVPFVHQSSLDGGSPSSAAIANASAQLVELIRQNYNHPSIVTWSVGNEIDIEPALSGRDRPARSLAMLQTLNALAKQEDMTRPTAYADCCEGTPLAMKGAQVLSGVTDLTAYNRYFGWYYATPDVAGPALDGFHAKYPKTPVGMSEYGAGGALTQHSDNPLGGPVDAGGSPHPEEYQSWVHEETWKALRQRPYLAGTWIWNMFDFASTSRSEGDAIDLNDKGLVTFDRKTRKDAFYFYKANWSTEPVLYVTGRRYVDRAYPVMDVRVYSNAAKAALTVNGRPLGEQSCPDRICIWREVRLNGGANQVAVIASIAGKRLTDRVEWTAPDAAGGLRIAAGTLTGHVDAQGHRFGSDNFFAGGTGKSLIPMSRGARVRKAVTGASDPILYGSYREGVFAYDLPLPNGRWTVTLHMFEPDETQSARSFDVTANGVPMLRGFNPAGAAGGILKPVTRSFEAVATDRRLRLEFGAAGKPAVLAGIEVRPAGSLEGARTTRHPARSH